MTNNVFEILKSRGYIFQTSDDAGIQEAFDTPRTLYQGFDPSSDSLHLGHLMSLVAMHRLQQAGHKVIFLMGGGTGRVGDPTGKSATRNLLTRDIIEKNSATLKNQVEKIGLVTFSGDNAALMLNNDEWLSKFSFLEDFLVGVARYFSVNEMISMRTFADRLDQEKPLSLLEFCYPALQAWDFLTLFDKYNCTIQWGGQDQWSNVLAGVDLIRKSREGKHVYAMTFPLLTTSDGVKMGKTEKGPIWLDSEKTSPYEFYQYLVKTPDSEVEKLFKLFTLLELEEIAQIIKDPILAQKRLAFEVTKLVHGEEEAKKASEAESIPEIMLKPGLKLIDALVASNCLPSKSEAKRRIEQGGVYYNSDKITDVDFELTKEGIIKYGKGCLLRIKQ